MAWCDHDDGSDAEIGWAAIVWGFFVLFKFIFNQSFG